MFEKLHKILINKKKTLAIAESCTGGLISKLATDFSGSSNYISLNLTTYSNEAKIQMLNVNAATIDKFGVVSKQVAEEMALGIKNLAKSDFGLGITGIAGPTGGTLSKPVGLVCIGIVDSYRRHVEEIIFPQNLSRKEIREQAAQKALELLEKFITNEK